MPTLTRLTRSSLRTSWKSPAGLRQQTCWVRGTAQYSTTLAGDRLDVRHAEGHNATVEEVEGNIRPGRLLTHAKSRDERRPTKQRIPRKNSNDNSSGKTTSAKGIGSQSDRLGSYKRHDILELVDFLDPEQSKRHHDLASFLEYADSKGMNKSSTVFKGTHYEYTVLESLRRFTFALTHCGKANDLGVDLIGFWDLPGDEHAPSQQLRVLVQCKSETLRPNHVRELAGCYDGAPSGWRGGNALLFLATSNEVTRGVREAVQRSSVPIGIVQINPEGVMKQALWNIAAAQRGLTGVGVTMKYVHTAPKKQVGKSSSIPIPSITSAVELSWMGKRWPQPEV